MPSVLLVEDERVTRHRIQNVLEEAKFKVTSVTNGAEALSELEKKPYDLMLLDVWMPGMNGLELLEKLEDSDAVTPKVVVMTADDTLETLLGAFRKQAYQYVTKPVTSEALVAVLNRALEGPSSTPPIRVLSAKPHWVELALPCDRHVAERIQSFMSRLDADLTETVREAIGRVFREMLLNAIEWGGKLDPNREVRVTYLRAKRMILYRIADPGEGFGFDEIDHAAIANPEDQPMEHIMVREAKGLRPGGFGILMSKTLADELLYNEAHNEVVFVKYLDADA